MATTLTKEEKIAIALCKSVSATLSLIASSIIIYKIYLRYKSQSESTVVSRRSSRSSNKNGKVTTYHRMLLSISILDVIHSTSSAFSTLLVPSYTSGTFARGTTTTCSMQGALQQLTPTIVIYMAMLNTYFMLKIRYNISDSVFRSKYEVWFHIIPIMHFLGTAIVGLSLNIFGPIVLTELGCWLDSYCIYTNTCTRSGPIFYNHFDWWPWSFAFIWLFICVIIVSINAVLIYTAIRTQERRNEQYFAAQLLHQSEANFTRSFSHPSGSSTLDKISSNFFSEATVARVKECAQQDQGVTIHDVTAMPPEPRMEEAKVELAQIDETEEASCSSEQQFSTTSPVIGNTSSHTNANHHIHWDNNVLGVRDTNLLPTRIPSSSLNRSEQSDDRMQPKLRYYQNHTKIKDSRVAGIQSTLYITSALFTAFWILMPWVSHKLQLPSSWRFFFAFMANIASPSQGIFNLLLYVRIPYSRLRATNPDWNRWKCVKICLFSSSD